MAYCTLDQLIDRYGRDMIVALTDRAAMPTGDVDSAVVDRAIAGADAVIDGYIGARYVLPIAAVPALIAEIAQAITLWKLHLTEPNPKVKADHDAALKQLADIARGMIRIPDATGIEPAATSAGGVQTVDRDRPFSADNLTGFI